MNLLVGLPLLALAAVVQATVLGRVQPLGGTVDLVLLLALSWTLVGQWQGGVVWGLLGGLSLDVLSAGPLGTHMLGLVVVAYLASLGEGRFWRSHVLLPLATALLGTLVYHLLVLAALSLAGYPVPWAEALTRITLPTVLLNTLAMLPIYHLARWLHAVVHPAPVTL